MMNDEELLIRFREGDLTPEDAREIDRRLQEEPELAARYERLQATVSALGAAVAASFSPFFASRVLARIRADARAPADRLYEALRWTFVRVAVACLVLAVGIGVYSVVGGAYGGTMLEVVLGLPEANLQTALILGG